MNEFNLEQDLLKSEEIEEAIQFLRGYLVDDVYTEKCIKYHNLAIYALENLKNQWIPCTEKLPEQCKDYQVTKMCKNEDEILYDTCSEIFWTSDNKWDCERDELCEWRVVAWKEKEKPYKIYEILHKKSKKEANDSQCERCNCNYNGKCIRKDNYSEEIGVCWMDYGQGEY